MKKLILLFIIGLYSCDNQQPHKTSMTSNQDYQVEELFMYDSIKVYSFRDHGRAHYFVKDMTSSIKYCGKNCSFVEEIKTVK